MLCINVLNAILMTVTDIFKNNKIVLKMYKTYHINSPSLHPSIHSSTYFIISSHGHHYTEYILISIFNGVKLFTDRLCVICDILFLFQNALIFLYFHLCIFIFSGIYL